MVFDHRLSQKDGLAGAFIVIVIHREVENFPLLIIVPVLRAGRSENRMLYGKDQLTAFFQPTGDVFCQWPEVFDIVESQGAEDDVKGLRGKLQAAHWYWI